MARVRRLKNSRWRNEAWENSRLIFSLVVCDHAALNFNKDWTRERERERREEDFNIIKFFNITRNNYISYYFLKISLPFFFYWYWKKVLFEENREIIHFFILFFLRIIYKRSISISHLYSINEDETLKIYRLRRARSEVQFFSAPWRAWNHVARVFPFVSFLSLPFETNLKERNGEPAVQRSEIFWTGGGWNNEGSFSIDECIFLSFFSFVARNNFVKSQKVWVTVRSFFFFLSSFIKCGDAYTVIKKK